VVPGTLDETDGRVTFRDAGGADSYDVIDEIACRALLTGARVVSAPARPATAGAARGDLAASGLSAGALNRQAPPPGPPSARAATGPATGHCRRTMSARSRRSPKRRAGLALPPRGAADVAARDVAGQVPRRLEEGARHLARAPWGSGGVCRRKNRGRTCWLARSQTGFASQSDRRVV
jgi:hypothetical protein